MKTIEIQVYKFEELPEHAQEKAIENYYDININYEWWNFTYEDAENIGLKISEFDLDRQSYCKANFIESAEYTAKRILHEHGTHCETYATAKNYLKDRSELVKKYSDGIKIDIVTEDNENKFDYKMNDIDCDFLHNLQEDYRIILQKEYDCLTSSEAIKESLINNEYNFTLDGKIY